MCDSERPNNQKPTVDQDWIYPREWWNMKNGIWWPTMHRWCGGMTAEQSKMAEEIDVTPAMLEAGWTAIEYQLGQSSDYVTSVLEDHHLAYVYRAMGSARAK